MNKKPEELLKEAREKTGKNQTEFASLLGLGLRAYQKFEAGDFPVYKTEHITKIDEILGTNLYELIYEQQKEVVVSDVLIGDESNNYVENRRKLKLLTSKTNTEVEHGVPVYDAVIDASFIERYNDTSLYTPIYYIDIPRLRNCDFAVFVKGSSMYPLMKSGTVAFIRVVDRFDYFDEGEMYFISTTNGFETVKYVQHGDKPDELRLIPHNDKIKAAIIKKDMVVKMCIVEAWLNFR